MSPKGDAIRTLIVDDQTLFRTGLAVLLDRDHRISVIGQAGSGLEAVELAEQVRPDVILMDLKLPGISGIEATRIITSRMPGIKILILTTFDSESHVVEALAAGAGGYVLKDSRAEAIIASIEALMAGESVIAGSITHRLLGLLQGGASSRTCYDGLTDREVEILRMIARGMPNKQIAFELEVNEKTVRNHISRLYEKLKIHDRAQAALYAARKGLVDLGPGSGPLGSNGIEA